jgi:hypothetical protein
MIVIARRSNDCDSMKWEIHLSRIELKERMINLRSNVTRRNFPITCTNRKQGYGGGLRQYRVMGNVAQIWVEF